MMRREHSVQNCSCLRCRTQRNKDGETADRNPLACKDFHGRGGLRTGTFSRRPRPLQQRTRPMLIDRLDSPPGEIVPANQRPTRNQANFFPISCNSATWHSIQYCGSFAVGIATKLTLADFEVFASSIHPGLEDSPDGWKKGSDRMDKLQAAMRDPMWFCANVAFAEALKDQTLHDAREKTDTVVKYQAKALADLRRRLSAETDVDLLLWTITILMAVDISYSDFDSWKAHAEGLDRIITMRGGLESLNGSPYVKHKIIGFNVFWHNKQMAIANSQQSSSYPKHPYPPDVCVAVAKLPRELADLALEGCFNVSLLKLVGDVCSISANLHATETKKIEDLRRLKLLGYELEELFRIDKLGQLERLLIAALVDYCISEDSDRGVHWLLASAIRMRISYLWCHGIKYQAKYARFMVWTASLLAACSETSAITFKLASNILSLCSEHHVLDKAYVLTTCRKFIWADFLTDRLEQKFDFECSPSDRSTSLSTTSSPPSMAKQPSRDRTTQSTVTDT